MGSGRQIDDALESHLDFAFRDDFGYLTASPSLTGTGLTVGVTLHVPALVLMKRFNRIVQGTTKFGFTFSGIYGERNDSIGNIFQITNQITLGVTEADTMEQLPKNRDPDRRRKNRTWPHFGLGSQ